MDNLKADAPVIWNSILVHQEYGICCFGPCVMPTRIRPLAGAEIATSGQRSGRH
jgi:hypothetical protein